MRRTRRSPPPERTPQQREAARLEREARRAARAGEPAPAPPPETASAEPEPPPGAPASASSGRARNTAIFSVLTGLSRIAGLGREIVAAAYYGTGGAASAFTLAFQVPNLIRALVADAALSSAFVPVFSELLERKRRREALHAASAMAGLLLVALTLITLAFIALAPVIMPLFTGDQFSPALDDLTVGLSRVLFPIVVLLGLNGLLVGILNAHDHFSIPALAPLVWNLVIVGGIVLLDPLFEGDEKLYAYAIGVVAGTAVQLAMAFPPLIRIGFPLRVSLDFRHDPHVRRVLALMLPVSLGLGLINVSLVLNSSIGSLISDEVPRAIDAAFRIYMLPQGMFSVAVATVLFPALSRLASRRDLPGLRGLTGTGMRQIALLLIPSAAAILALSEPMVRLVYERGEFDAGSTELVSEALFWFAFSLPFSGVNLLLTRTFFSLQQPWMPTRLAVWSLVVNVVVSLALYEPLGIGGIVIGTTVSNAVMMGLLATRLRRELGGLEVARTLRAAAVMVAAAALLAGVAYGTWRLLDSLLGDALPAQLLAVGLALALGAAAYGAAVLASGLPEARQILELFMRRLRR
ncbi:MAG TPA: murein biosynthesis integral membrane protein MurJ [Solirubrobacteraceae bacterium]|jgi:putative peptidoglycan lipid II flippase|nr:murein biosynthesis integral membrane protein MurJ [Solirubrobacteraceae bacterium]